MKTAFTHTRGRLLLMAVTMLAPLALPAAASAHVELISSSPEPGDNLESAPTEVTITFDDELDPDLSSFTVTDAEDNEVGSGEVDLTIADRNVMTGRVSIDDPGIYTVAYRAEGIDGHQLDGTFSFGVNARQQIPAPTGGEEGPDTAMPAPELPLVELAGALLLALAFLLALRPREIWS
jgi:methionine-rich copper-binding protein CopC